MEDHPNATRMLKAARDVMARDMPAFLEAFSPTCTWRVPGKSSLAGVLHGHEGLNTFFGRMIKRAGGTFKVAPEEALGSDAHIVFFLRASAETPDGPVDVRIAHFATVDTDGRFEKNWFLPSDPAAADRLFG